MRGARREARGARREARSARSEAGSARREAGGPRSEVGSPRSEFRAQGFEIRLRRRVQFSETDVAGIVHFSNFFRYFEDAEHALWREAGLSIHPEKSPIGWPRVAASCEFQRPLRFEQEFEIGVRISEMTRRTITYSGEITSNGDRIATGSWKIACVSKQPDGSMKSAEIPQEIAMRLKSSEHRASHLAPRTSHS